MDISTIHLEGNNAPVAAEVDASPSRIVGDVPHDLHGLFVRNGPNPRSGWSPHLFAGDGMVHGIWLTGGGARYRNRYVRTPLYADPSTPRDGRFVTTANTHVIHHCGQLLALEEGGLPYGLDLELETDGPFDFGGRLRGAMTAHPKRCPLTGELLFFGYGLFRPYLTYRRVGDDGVLHSTPIEVDRPMMLHDFAITSSRTIFVESPWVFDARHGPNPWRWDTSRAIRVGVLPRHGRSSDVRWFELPSIAHLSHSANAHDEGDTVVLTGTRIASPDALPYAHEWRIDLSANSVTERPLDDDPSEYPRVADGEVGTASRYIYTSSFALTAEPDHSEIHRYDLRDGTRTSHGFPPGHTCGEPVLAGTYVLTFVHTRETNTSYLAILDADHVNGRPIAEVHLPVRVPGGFHGSWVPDLI